ncbi:MAG: putative major facilitator superfamily [Herminiimonas sp.]|nr:putative major facilitator superfamily [Herminiimonas sp.]
MAKTNNRSLAAQPDGVGGSAWMTLLFATACGLIVANLYYAQPLIGPIGKALGLAPQVAGLIVTLTQIGYGIGLLLIVPMADIVENRRLVITLLIACTIALAGAAMADNALLFFAAAACIGLSSVSVQILVPLAAHLAPEASRGRVVGNVMSGLLLGIMLARPISSFVTDIWGWHTVFAASATVIACLGLVLVRILPVRRPVQRLRYAALVGSMWRLLRSEQVLRRRAAYQACLFCAFSLFWTTAPLLLAGPHFRLTQRGIALFALAGVAGVIAAPIAGRLADKGWSRPVSAVAMATAAGAFLLSRIGQEGSTAALVNLTLAAIMLDFGVSANLVVGQRAIFSLGAEYRARLNGLYMAIFFAGGAAGSAIGAWAYANGGWTLASRIGFALPVAALCYFATELLPARARRPGKPGESKI